MPLLAELSPIEIDVPRSCFSRDTFAGICPPPISELSFFLTTECGLRLMHEDNLLCLRKKRFLATTNSDHSLPVYPNFAAEVDITAPDLLWASDLTGVHPKSETVSKTVAFGLFWAGFR